jgi:hypothetical protein
MDGGGLTAAVQLLLSGSRAALSAAGMSSLAATADSLDAQLLGLLPSEDMAVPQLRRVLLEPEDLVRPVVGCLA